MRREASVSWGYCDGLNTLFLEEFLSIVDPSAKTFRTSCPSLFAWSPFLSLSSYSLSHFEACNNMVAVRFPLHLEGGFLLLYDAFFH